MDIHSTVRSLDSFGYVAYGATEDNRGSCNLINGYLADNLVQAPDISASSSAPPTGSRPLGVGILAVLLIIGGLFNLLAGIGLTRLGDPSAFGIPSLALVLGLVYLAAGIGFLPKDVFAWYLGLAISFLDLARRIVLLAYGVGYGEVLFLLLGILVELVIIYYLLEPRVQRYFGMGKQAAQNASSEERSS